MTTTPPPRDAAEPAYAPILTQLTERIRLGLYDVGDLLPTEAELCAEFAVSRYTVREALRRLTDAGLIRRQQGHGTRVLSREPQPSYVQSMHSIEGLFDYARDTRFDVRAIRFVQWVDGLGRSPEGWLRIEGLRYSADGGAVCASTVYLNGAFAAIEADLRPPNGAIYRMVEQRFGVRVERVEQTFSAGPAPEDVAAALGLEPGAPCVSVVRRYFDVTGRTMIAAFNTYPAERFSYTMSLTREEPSGRPAPRG